MTCAGVPFSHARPLSVEERAWLVVRAAHLRRRRIGYGVGTAFVPLLLCLPFMLSFLGDGAVLGIFPALAACIALPLRWIDASKRATAALASASAAEVDVFEGVPSVGALAEASLSTLMAAGLVLNGETPQRIDRIRVSGESIGMNGTQLESPVWTDVTEVARPHSADAAFPSRVPDFIYTSPERDRRALSTAELAELRRLQPEQESLRQKGCLLGWCAYFLAFAFAAPNDTPDLKGAVLALKAVALLYVGWRVALAVRERTRLRRDLAEGSVVRVSAESGIILEVLPRLGLVWTVGGEPAVWRHGAQAKPRPPV